MSWIQNSLKTHLKRSIFCRWHGIKENSLTTLQFYSKNLYIIPSFAIHLFQPLKSIFSSSVACLRFHWSAYIIRYIIGSNNQFEVFKPHRWLQIQRILILFYYLVWGLELPNIFFIILILLFLSKYILLVYFHTSSI